MTGTANNYARILAAVAMATALGTVGAVSATTPSAAAVPLNGCPALYLLGVQGTGQSWPGADPLADTGVVGALIGPVVAAVPDLVQRAYIAYGAGFGGAVPGGGPDPYVVSVSDARNQLDAAAVQVTDSCPDTMIAGIGYSQGAQAVSAFARDVGAGRGPIAPERVAGIALYADPDRAPGAAVIPGRPGQRGPDAAPGTGGAAVGAVVITDAAAAGGGIADGANSYGALTGRVAEVCADADLACSAPDHAALLRVGAQIAAQADLRDPLAAMGSINAVLSGALADAWTTVLRNDFQVGGGNLDYAPQRPLAQRLINAADPRLSPPSPEDIDFARARWAQITATVVANPIVLLPKLVGQLAGAWGGLVADNSDLLDPAIWVRYADTVARHTSYVATGQLTSGIAWMIALAHDLAGRHR